MIINASSVLWHFISMFIKNQPYPKLYDLKRSTVSVFRGLYS